MNTIWAEDSCGQVFGNTFRPGGLKLTSHALKWSMQEGFVSQGDLAVDMGCGANATLTLLEQFGLRALGIDRALGPMDARFASSMLMHRLCADVTNPPLKTGVAQLLLFECVLSLLKDPRSALLQAYRLLDGHGICIISDLTCRQMTTAPKDLSGCLAGAKTLATWRDLFAEAHFSILLEEDHQRELKQLAARLIWYGEEAVKSFFSLGRCSCHQGLHNFGYRLWIVEKESLCTH